MNIKKMLNAINIAKYHSLYIKSQFTYFTKFLIHFCLPCFSTISKTQQFTD